MTSIIPLADHSHWFKVPSSRNLADNNHQVKEGETISGKNHLREWMRNTCKKYLMHEAAPKELENYRQDNLLWQIKAAESHGRLTVGIAEIYEAAQHMKGMLLVGEKDCLFPTVNRLWECSENRISVAGKGQLSIKEAINAAIENVIAEGGTIEFVETGRLKKYGSLVMIVKD